MTDPSSGEGDDNDDDARRDGGSTDPVVDAVHRTYPGRPVDNLRAVDTGNRKRTVVVRFGDDDAPASVVVQIADAAGFRTEVALARAIRARTSVPTPAVLAGGSLTDAGRGYVITEHAPGADLHTRFTSLGPPQQCTVARTFGDALAQLHESFAFDGFGALGVGAAPWATVVDASDPGSLLRVDPADGRQSWPRWLRAYADAGVDALPAAFDDLRPQLREAVAATCDAVPASPPALLYPWDLRPGNALVDDGAVSAVLDWGDSLAADPGLAVAKVEHLVCDWYVDDGKRLTEAFRRAYRARRPLPSVPDGYRLVAVVESAVDSAGVVTRPRYPEVDGAEAVAFHRERLRDVLAAIGE
ncbi:phosphotransferase family protein [Halobaculum marinum]|uniref:Phosphotransferase family protein n=1 Tax=Halobaculum marinum TaxID=3031996 RepID=A0ABD5WY97_9EURY|nr:phosphotransferase [Halobaculum sp. DT55]